MRENPLRKEIVNQLGPISWIESWPKNTIDILVLQSIEAMRYGERRLLSEFGKQMNDCELSYRLFTYVCLCVDFDFDSVRLTTQLRVWFTYANLYGKGNDAIE